MVFFAELPQDVHLLIVGNLDALSSMNLSLVNANSYLFSPNDPMIPTGVQSDVPIA